MAHWLFKSEPEAWSWDDQVAAGAKGTEWSGVRNYQARNFMRTMAVGDQGLFYHSADVRAAVGIVAVIAAAHPDSTADDPAWECVDIAAVEPLARPVTLAEVKATAELADMALVRNSRLSVQPVTDAEWAAMLALASRPAADAPAAPGGKPPARAKPPRGKARG